MTYQDFIHQGRKRLEQAALECGDPAWHIQQLVAETLKWEAAELIRRSGEEIPLGELQRLETLLERRLAGEPLQYLLGHAWFWKSRFAVGPGVLIPRPETERLIELALEKLPARPLRIAELGAGTGAIGVSLLLERPQWEWFAWENNPASWPFLTENAKLLPPGSRWHATAGDFFQGAPAAGPFDAVVCNPPYVRRGEIDGLSREVRQEPRQALDGGASGMEIIVRLAEFAKKTLAPAGALLLETGSDQGLECRKLLLSLGYQSVTTYADMAGKDRVVFAIRP